MYDVRNWYWAVKGNDAQVFSSAANAYVDVADAAYVAWQDEGRRVATKITANDMLLKRIDFLEASITNRMLQEAAAGSTATFSGGLYAGKTSAQAIAAIVADKDALRAQIA